MNQVEREQELSLNVLRAVEADGADGGVSQRQLAKHAGVALGLINSCVRRCVDKGWVKVQQTPAKRFLYFLTPQGLSEKGRLTYWYLKRSLSFYRAASTAYQSVMTQAETLGVESLVFVGQSELTEIALLWAKTTHLTQLGCYAPADAMDGADNLLVASGDKQSDDTPLMHCTDGTQARKWVSQRAAWVITAPNAQGFYEAAVALGVLQSHILIPDLPDLMQIKVPVTESTKEVEVTAH